MKIPRSVRDLYQQLEPQYAKLKAEVDRIAYGQKEHRWHYESRLKSEQSYAMKLETGRVADPAKPEDFFACTLVVENRSRIADAVTFICDRFDFHSRRPRDPSFTHLRPDSFDFDDLRLYVKWKDDPTVPPTGLAGVLFEVQIKTFLQHAWGIATHDFIYKTDDVDWSSSRIAFQVKAMLENAELSIGEAKRLTDCEMLKRTDRGHSDLKETIQNIRARWEGDQLPEDLRRLALNVIELTRALKIPIADVWQILDGATASGKGTQTANLSPFGSILAALLDARGPSLFDPLSGERAPQIFVPSEIDLPALSSRIGSRLIRPPVSI
jgi:ppGpp synthetase/RelA/SpoT-type nucleotidyltranferase